MTPATQPKNYVVREHVAASDAHDVQWFSTLAEATAFAQNTSYTNGYGLLYACCGK